MASRALPSLRTEPGSLIPIGFVDEPDERHLTASVDAMRAMAQEARVLRSHEGTLLRVSFCHHQHNPLLSPQLFGFAVHFFDSDGQRVDALEHDLPIRYSLNLNLPVELQQETALLLLAELVNRQTSVRPDADDFDISTLGKAIQIGQDRAFEVVSDALRFGWRNALETVVALARSEGWELIIEYQGDPLPTRDDITSRLKVLKDAYNNIDEVRLLVDRFVSFFGGKGRFRIAGGSEEARAQTQGWSGVMHVSEYLSHLTRDAQVLGNGYATFHSTPSPAITLRDPLTVEIQGQNTFYINERASSDRRLITEPTDHFKGIDQLETPYGMSVLEPLVASYEMLRTVSEARGLSLEFAGKADATDEMIAWAAKCEALYQEKSAEFGATLRDMYYLPLKQWDFEPGPLYFEGHETYTP